jgi:formylglycine-generating enzyme required for sulfatase activity
VGKWIIKRQAGIDCLLLIGVIIWGMSCRKNTNPQDNNGKPQIIKTTSGIEMILIPGGDFFEMGSKSGSPDETPVHRVWISSFWMDRYEVVQEQFKKFQISDPSHFKDPNNPLEQMNWTDATRFCNERSRAEGFEPCYDEETWECNFQANGYRLPTEAEGLCMVR